MTTDTTYNGWTNYETWNVKLWLDNDEGTYHEVNDMARHARSEYALADALKDWVGEMMPDLGASMAADLLGAALCEVNWQEIAAAYIEDEDNGDGAYRPVVAEPMSDATAATLRNALRRLLDYAEGVADERDERPSCIPLARFALGEEPMSDATAALMAKHGDED